MRSPAAWLGVALGIMVASSVTFALTFYLGAVIGVQVSAGDGPMNEHHLGHGVLAGFVTGTLSALIVGGLLARWQLKRPTPPRE